MSSFGRWITRYDLPAFEYNADTPHAQPLLAYVRLLGVEPMASGSLRVDGGAGRETSTFQLRADGHGSLQARGKVILETRHGTVRGGPGRVVW